MHRMNICEKKINFKHLLFKHEMTIDDMKLLNEGYELDQCDVCGTLGAELHHYAPRHLFDDAEDWPKGHLCKYHHKLWHDIIRMHK